MAATATVSSLIARSSLLPQLIRAGRIIAQAAFPVVTVLSSLYLLLCHIPITFMGFIRHPLFTWMPAFAVALQWFYWPTFLMALYCAVTGPQKAAAQKLAKYFIAAQVLFGLVTLVPAVIFPETAFPYLAWPLLFGPNLKGATGDIGSYVAALLCLVPMVWMGLIRLSGSIRIEDPPLRGPARLPVFAGSAAVVSAIYSTQTGALYHLDRASYLKELAASLLLHVVIWTGAFLLLHISDRLARRFRNPRLAQIAVRGVATALLVSVVVRKILLYAIAFNNTLADVYAGALALAIVLYVVPRHGKSRQILEESRPSPFSAAFIVQQLLIAACATAVYLFALRLMRFDWNQLITSLATILIWALVFLFISRFFRRPGMQYRPRTLALLAAPVAAGLALFLLLASGSASAFWLARPQETLERYATTDPSMYLIENVLRPSVNDGADRDYYDFLNQHANIAAPITAPDISLVSNLGAREGPRPNIFVFVIDALRKDYLSPYNSRVDFTPNIQRFAEESVVFQDPMTLYGGSALAEPAIWTGVREIHKHYPEPLARMNALAKMLEADQYHSYLAYDFILTRLVPQTENVTPLRKEYKAWQESEFGEVLLELEDKLSHRTDPNRPVFAYSQPANVHSLVVGNHSEATKHPHPGFHDDYVFALERVDRELGQFVQFLKDHGMYDNSVVILTADHGESLGDWGRWGHITIAPEIMRIPLIIHLPPSQKTQLVWDTKTPAFLEDIAPSIYYLAGHRDLKKDQMLGHALFTSSAREQTAITPDHYFMMSSYMPVFGVLTADENGLYIVDASLRRSAFYDLQHDPTASENRITAQLKKKYEAMVRQDLEKLDRLYHVQFNQVGSRMK